MKYRKPIFTDAESCQVMKDILRVIAEHNEISIIEMEVVDDHIHRAVSFPPHHSISSVMKALKGSSARERFKPFPETKKRLWGGLLWSASYFASTVGEVSKEMVLTYVQNQLTEYNNGRPRRDSSPG